jgi:hypothetical protein
MAALVRVHATAHTLRGAVGNDCLLDYKIAALADKDCPAAPAVPCRFINTSENEMFMEWVW